MKNMNYDERVKTGITNLDEILSSGLPKGSLVVFAGTPGAGKTILSQQLIFHNAAPEKPAVFFQSKKPRCKSRRSKK